MLGNGMEIILFVFPNDARLCLLGLCFGNRVERIALIVALSFSRRR